MWEISENILFVNELLFIREFFTNFQKLVKLVKFKTKFSKFFLFYLKNCAKFQLHPQHLQVFPFTKCICASVVDSQESQLHSFQQILPPQMLNDFRRHFLPTFVIAFFFFGFLTTKVLCPHNSLFLEMYFISTHKTPLQAMFNVQ